MFFTQRTMAAGSRQLWFVVVDEGLHAERLGAPCRVTPAGVVETIAAAGTARKVARRKGPICYI